MICIKCGKELQNDMLYCPNCGRKTNDKGFLSKVDISFVFGLVALIGGYFSTLVAWIFGGIGFALSFKYKNIASKVLNLVAIILSTVFFAIKLFFYADLAINLFEKIIDKIF